MRKLTWATVGMTYFLMVWGNLVSSTGSGLACPDWPLCHGTVTPPLQAAVVLEWGHRILAFLSTVLIVTTVFKLLKSAKSQPSLARSARVVVALLIVQILLGATTVLLGLSITISTIHLLVANTVLAGLLLVACVTTWGDNLVAPGSEKIRRLSVFGLLGLLVQLGLGAWVRHSHSGLACPMFPNCLESFFPSPFTLETFLAFTHRWWGVLMLGVFVQIAMAAARVDALFSLGQCVAGIAILQVGLGIATVMTQISIPIRAMHAAVGYALWSVLVITAYRSGAFQKLWKRT